MSADDAARRFPFLPRGRRLNLHDLPMPAKGLFLASALALAAAAMAADNPPAAAAPVAAPSAAAPRTSAEIVRGAPPSAWRTLDPNDVLLMTLPGGTVWIELAPRFAPRHAANLRTLVAQRYFDGLAVLRVQDNFVAQWGDPDAEAERPPGGVASGATSPRPLGAAAGTLPPEFAIDDQGLLVTRLKDRDVYAPVTGFVDGFPVAVDPAAHRAWITHCYGIVGAGRGDTVDSGSGAELYVVIGQAPRTLDLNIAPVGRVIQGMELLSSLPRGGGAMGFYAKREQQVRIERVRRLADLPADQRPSVQVFRTDTPTWADLVESRRNRRDAWYVHRAGAIDVCSVAVPVRIGAPAAAGAAAK
jgi:peptidylprolyl isomerase